MTKTGIVKDERYLERDMDAYHVENPEQLAYIYRELGELKDLFKEIPPRAETRVTNRSPKIL
jgi:hypothetical protein